MAEGLHLDNGMEFGLVRTAYQDTGPNAGTTQQRSWAAEALTVYGAETVNRGPAGDLWSWANLMRRADYQVGSYDVLFEWVADPLPGFTYAGFGAVEEGATLGPVYGSSERFYTVRLRRTLDSFNEMGADLKRYYQTVVWHELGHVVIGLLMETFGTDTIRGQLRHIFGGGPIGDEANPGPWAGQIREAFAEHFKDVMYRERVYNNKTKRGLVPWRWEKFCDLIIQQMHSPGGKGPMSRVMGDVRPDLVNRYGAYGGSFVPDRWPRPGVQWEYGLTGDLGYDYPYRQADAGNGRQGFQLQWGGRGGGAKGTGALRPMALPDTALPNRGSYVRPPRAGSQIRVHVRWDDPQGEWPLPYWDFAASHEFADTAKPKLPAGVMGLDVGGPFQTDQIGRPMFGPNFWFSNGRGVAWLKANPGDTGWTAAEIPRELQTETWTEKGIFASDNFRRYEPLYFDVRASKEWSMNFTVPEHNGELALVWRWPVPGWSQQNNVSNEIWEPHPIRTYPNGEYWTKYPEPLPLRPFTMPAAIDVAQGPLGAVRGPRRTQYTPVTVPPYIDVDSAGQGVGEDVEPTEPDPDGTLSPFPGLSLGYLRPLRVDGPERRPAIGVLPPDPDWSAIEGFTRSRR